MRPQRNASLTTRVSRTRNLYCIYYDGSYVGVEVCQKVVGHHAEVPRGSGGLGAGQGDEGTLGELGGQAHAGGGTSESFPNLQVGRASHGVHHHHIHFEGGVAVLIRGSELAPSAYLHIHMWPDFQLE